MCDRNESISLIDRWEIDVQSYKNGAKTLVEVPQCETCRHYIKGNALHCKCFDNETKPKYVLFPQKECPSYENNNPISLNIRDDRENKVYGGLFGFCVGDALGVPVEFSTREERKRDPINEMRAYGTYHQPFGTWSDDTSLTLCLIDAINNGYSTQKIAKNFLDFYEKGHFTPYGVVFDIGNSTGDAIIRMRNERNPINCGGKLDTDNGNGSLMRIFPIAFYGQRLSDKERIRMIEEVSSLTHGHNRSKLACILYVEFVIQIILGKEKERALDETIMLVRNNCLEAYSEELKLFERILNKEIISLSEDDIKSTGYVIDTLEAALWTFFHAVSYRDTILKAINLGGDTDTIAAIAGGIAGIYYGVKDIPNAWIQCIAKKEELFQMFEQFCSICQ